MAVSSALLTVEEFARLPEPCGGLREELHHGEVVTSPPVKKLHTLLQHRLVKAICPVDGLITIKELPFQPEPEYQLWIADVAVFEFAVFDRADDDGYFPGVPAIVVEVLSPSEGASELLGRESICLRNGGREFWVVDPRRQVVRVTDADGRWLSYGVGDQVESPLLRTPVVVSDLFSR